MIDPIQNPPPMPRTVSGAKGGAAGRGAVKARTSEQARAAVNARWAKYRAAKQVQAAAKEGAKVNEAMNEPEITIGGQRLDLGQAMTVRVAVQSFAVTLRAEGLGDDAHGRAMTNGYLIRIGEINKLMQESMEANSKAQETIEPCRQEGAK